MRFIPTALLLALSLPAAARVTPSIYYWDTRSTPSLETLDTDFKVKVYRAR